jgi:fatty acid desaturase
VSAAAQQAAPGGQQQWAQREAALARSWDAHLAAATELYRGRTYNLMTDNCHGLVVQFLRSVQYGGGGSWDMVKLAALVFLRAKYAGWAAWLRTWLPFLLLVPAGLYWGGSAFAWAYLGVAGGLVAWFLAYTYLVWRPCSECSAGSGGAAPREQPQQWLA